MQYHIHSSWATLQFELNQWQRITTVLPKEGRTGILLKRDADPGPFQRRIAMVMGLQSNHNVYKAHATRSQNCNVIE